MKRNTRTVACAVRLIACTAILCLGLVAVVETVAQDTGPQPVESSAIQPDADPGAAATAPRKGINFLELLSKGGWFMLPLGVLSVMVVMISIERFIALRRHKVFPQPLIDGLSELTISPGGLDPRTSYQLCQRYPSSAAQVLRAMLIKVGRPQLEVEHAVSEASQREASRLNHMVTWLTLAAAIAPLIGLLGTVWGITQAFYDTTQMTAGENRSEALAQGIYTALVTTLCGLMIAIPSAILAHFFENRVVMLMNEIEEMVFNLMPQVERYEGKLRFTAAQSPTGGNGEAEPPTDPGDRRASRQSSIPR